MAVASGRIAAPAAFAPSSRWRSKPAQVGAIVGAWLVAYFLLKGEFDWPTSLTWQELPRKLDNARFADDKTDKPGDPLSDWAGDIGEAANLAALGGLGI